MKIKKILILALLTLVVIPGNVLAASKDCGSYSADKCPANNCQVENGACVKAHIGQNFCSQEDVINVMRVMGYFIFIAKIAIPFIIILFGTFDMYKAVTGGDEKSMSSSAKKLGIRMLIGFSVFLLPTILHLILSTLNDYEAISDDANICLTCLLKPSECENGVPADTNPFDDELFDEYYGLEHIEEDENKSEEETEEEIEVN